VRKIHKIELVVKAGLYDELRTCLFFTAMPTVEQALEALDVRWPVDDEPKEIQEARAKVCVSLAEILGSFSDKIRNYLDSPDKSPRSLWGEYCKGVTIIYQLENLHEV
jgi:hypothetical protein